MQKHTQNNFLAYLLILISFSILIFFTSNIYSQIQIQQDTIESQNIKISTHEQDLTRLKNLEKELSAEDSLADKAIIWFTGEFSDENIINHIYSYAHKTNLWDERIIIRSIWLLSWEKSDTWFKRAKVDLEIITSSQDTLFSFMNYLTDEESTYRFYINTFDYELWETSWNITVNIPLILYYK